MRTNRLFFSFRTLRGRLVLLVCLAAAPAIALIFFIAVEQRESALKRLEVEARHLAALASREHRHQLSGAKNLLLNLGDAFECGRDAPSAVSCPTHLPALLVGYPQFANIGVLSANGTVLCSAVPTRDHHDWKENPAFVRALTSRQVEVGTYIVGSIVRRPVLHLAHAIRGGALKPCAISFVALDLRWLEQLARQAHLPVDHSLLIVDREGRILADSGAVDTPAPGETTNARILIDAINRRGGTMLTIGTPPVSRLFVATPMEGLDGIFVVAGLPSERVQADVNAIFFRTLLGLLLLTLLTVASVILAAEFSILRVLRALSTTARRFGGGDLDARAALPQTHGELRDLVTSFNTMADSLATRQREAELAEDQLRALSSRLQVARETEAGRIARELHDELGQVLTSLKIDLATIGRWHAVRAEALPVADPRPGLSEMSARIDGAIDFVRRIASELRPSVLDRLGLSAAIEGLVRGFEEKCGFAITLDVRDMAEPIDPLIAITLFRIVQEALTNIARHAGATEVTIDFAGTDEGLMLTIADNGKGIDEHAADGANALGILGMKERTRLVGGTWSLRRGGVQGTIINVSVPRKPPEIVRSEGD